MTPVNATFGEVAAERRIASSPLSHVSIELGHLYMEDFEAGPDRLRQQFRRAEPWASTARRSWQERVPGGRARVSTCFLIDDYFSRFSTPAELIPVIVETAADSGLTIDYLARESACARAGGVEPAKLVEDRLVADPPVGTNGSRPPARETGWLCNGTRSPVAGVVQAMGVAQKWRPPAQNAKRGHSVFVDVELWNDDDGERTWSCPFLAAVWQLLRLGMLRDDGRPPVVPQPRGTTFPDDWADLPPIIRLVPSAAPFAAYTTLSVLSSRFMPVELAVRTILSQVAVDAEVLGQVVSRSEDEGVPLEDELVDRLSYVFT
ncbi:SCO2522 family protein [Sphaerisporangium sp. TRM90804]|uniref:SCO2522 family protein n=1 Tax=Sphaerisporangium sp. TRM90804 TaxID=3031113 RepID=UPI00244B10DA|nr:SCO2522 family protein [Sphaerisporangium sp. TRM90804]MDH2424337.1 SCO2522 family protein [Sphaerisporangium sp. TRM90804]